MGGVAGETATQFMQHGFTNMIKCKNTLVGLCLLVLPFDLATMDLDFLSFPNIIIFLSYMFTNYTAEGKGEKLKA